VTVQPYVNMQVKMNEWIVLERPIVNSKQDIGFHSQLTKYGISVFFFISLFHVKDQTFINNMLPEKC